MTAFDLEQLGILVLSTAAIFLVNLKNEKVRRFGPVIGLLSQPLWLHQNFIAGQWGMLALAVLYTVAWIIGIRNSWFKK